MQAFSKNAQGRHEESSIDHCLIAGRYDQRPSYSSWGRICGQQFTDLAVHNDVWWTTRGGRISSPQIISQTIINKLIYPSENLLKYHNIDRRSKFVNLVKYHNIERRSICKSAEMLLLLTWFVEFYTWRIHPPDNIRTYANQKHLATRENIVIQPQTYLEFLP